MTSNPLPSPVPGRQVGQKWADALSNWFDRHVVISALLLVFFVVIAISGTYFLQDKALPHCYNAYETGLWVTGGGDLVREMTTAEYLYYCKISREDE